MPFKPQPVIWVRIFLISVLCLTGCQYHKVTTIRVVSSVGLPVPKAEVLIGTIYSGFPYPPPSYFADENGVVAEPKGIHLNAGSAITVRVNNHAQYYSWDDLVFERKKTLVLRLRLEEADIFPNTTSEPNPWNQVIEPQSLKFRE